MSDNEKKNDVVGAEDTLIDEDLAEDVEEEDVDIDVGDDLKLDENGDIIIPDDDEDEGDGENGRKSEEDPDKDEDKDEDEGEDEDEDEDESSGGDEGDQDSDSDEDGEQNAQGEDAISSEGKPKAEADIAEPAHKEPDAKDARIAALERELAAIRSQSRETLKSLGVTEGDEISGLVKLAAEAEGKTEEEYLKQKQERDRTAEALRLMQQTAFNAKIAADLAEVHAAYPDTKVYTSVKDFPNFKEFARLRDLKLSPKQAYIASHPDSVRQNVAAATRQQSLNDTKKHLKSAVSKSSRDNTITMTKRELAECRDLFPGMSDKEIMKLYRDTKTK